MHIKIAAILIFFWPSIALAINIPLTVTERSGIQRLSAPVTYGVPFSIHTNLLSVSELGIIGTDAQFRVLSRYNGAPNDSTKPIRMVLVDFQTDIEANATRQFTLTTNGSGPVAGPDLAVDKESHVEIDTGNAAFRIRKSKGNIFDSAVVGSTPLVSSPAGDGFIVVSGGTEYSSANTVPSTILIEENGPLRCVVKIEGEFADASGNLLYPPPTSAGTVPDSPIRYTVRYVAYRNKSYLKLQVSLRNENKGWSVLKSDPIHNLPITEAYLKTTLNGLDARKTVAFDKYLDEFVDGRYALFQDEISDGTRPVYEWKYTVAKNGTAVASGTRYDAYVAVRDNAKGLMAANRWFWQNYPAGMAVNGNELRMHLWPETGSAHRILGGIWKTHELLYYFHGPEPDYAQSQAHIKKRLIARCSDAYYAGTEFLPWMAPGQIDSAHLFPGGERLKSALDAQADMHKARYDSRFEGMTLRELQEGREVLFDTDNHASWYGWLRFGNTPRGKGHGYSSQHYDWSYIPLLGFLRFGNFEMFDVGEEFVFHQSDIIVLHDKDITQNTEDYKYAGGHRYESRGLFLDNMEYHFNIAPKKASHLWTKGLALQYLLTGEFRFREALLESSDHVLRVKDLPVMTDRETRNQGRGIATLLNGYRISGDSRYLTAAYSLFDPHLLKYEGGTGDGTSGWIDSASGLPGRIWMLYDAILVEPLIQLHEALSSAGRTAEAGRVRDFLIRWGYWIRNEIIPGMHKEAELGSYRNNYSEYYPYVFNVGWLSESRTWDETVPPNGSICPLYADLFACIYTLTGETSWLDLSRNLFKDYYVYQTDLPGWKPKKESTLPSGITDAYNNAFLKHGKSLTTPMYYLSTEYKISKRNKGPRIRSITVK